MKRMMSNSLIDWCEKISNKIKINGTGIDVENAVVFKDGLSVNNIYPKSGNKVQIGSSSTVRNLEVSGNTTTNGLTSSSINTDTLWPLGDSIHIGNVEAPRNLVVYGNGNYNGSNAFWDLNVVNNVGSEITAEQFYRNLNSNVTITNFYARKFGKFIYVEGTCNSGNYTSYSSIFDINEDYRPAIIGEQCTCYYSVHWGNVSYINSSYALVNSNSTTDTDGQFSFRFMYKVA